MGCPSLGPRWGGPDWLLDEDSPDWIPKIGSQIGHPRLSSKWGALNLLSDGVAQIGFQKRCTILAPSLGVPDCVPHLEANLWCSIWEPIFGAQYEAPHLGAYLDLGFNLGRLI